MRHEIMDSLLAEEKGSMSIQNSPFCRRLRIEEPILKKPSTKKTAARCLFGVPDHVECKNIANRAEELTMIAFKHRWDFDPMTAEPVDHADKTLDANSILEFSPDRTIYKWEQVFDEELIQDVGKAQADTPQADSAVLQITPASESKAPEVLEVLPVTPPTATAEITIPTATISTIHMIDIPIPMELLETSAHEDFHSLSTGCCSTSCGLLETVSPRESRFKSPKSMKQCRITDYMQVIKKPRAKKLR